MIAETWRSMRPGPRALTAAVLLVIALNVLVGAVTVVTGGTGRGGPTSSSYATADDGLAAYAELLARRGHPVERLRVSLDRAALERLAPHVETIAEAEGLGVHAESVRLRARR